MWEMGGELLFFFYYFSLPPKSQAPLFSTPSKDGSSRNSFFVFQLDFFLFYGFLVNILLLQCMNLNFFFF